MTEPKEETLTEPEKVDYCHKCGNREYARNAKGKIVWHDCTTSDRSFQSYDGSDDY